MNLTDNQPLTKQAKLNLCWLHVWFCRLFEENSCTRKITFIHTSWSNND